MISPLQLIVGLGNPGAQYERTRHNAGHWFVEALAEKAQTSFRLETKCKGFVAKTVLQNQPVILLFPNNYMNLSGEAVVACAHFYKCHVTQILIVHDELDLPLGAARLKQGGGHGGHNGLRSIIQHMGDAQFWRLRIGIGRPVPPIDVVNYVLQVPSTTERAEINNSIDTAILALPKLVSGDAQAAMRELH